MRFWTAANHKEAIRLIMEKGYYQPIAENMATKCWRLAEIRNITMEECIDRFVKPCTDGIGWE